MSLVWDMCTYVCVCVCVRERERERERDGGAYGIGVGKWWKRWAVIDRRVNVNQHDLLKVT